MRRQMWHPPVARCWHVDPCLRSAFGPRHGQAARGGEGGEATCKRECEEVRRACGCDNTGAAISCAADLHLVAIRRGAVGLAAGTGVHEQLHVELDGPRAFLAGTLVLLAVFRGRVHANHRERVLVHVPRPLGLGQLRPTRVAQVVVAGLVA